MLLGSAVTSSILKADPRYKDAKATPLLLSSYALEQRAATDFEVMKVVNGIKDEYGAGASTLLRIFNASGERLFFRHDFHRRGNVWKYPFDMIIENGQWSVVLIVHTAAGQSVAGGVVYHTTQMAADLFCGWDVPYWDGPFSSGHKNTVHCEIQKMDYWRDPAKREEAHDRTNNGKASVRTKLPVAYDALYHEYQVSMLTAGGTSPVTDVIFGRVEKLE